MQGNSMRLFGVVILSPGNSPVLNEDGGGGNVSMPNSTNYSNRITNPNTITHHHNHQQLHETEQVFKLFGKVIVSQLSNHDHQDQMINDNNTHNPSRKRERSWSSSASSTTTIASLPKKPKKKRSLRPSKEEISEAHLTFPPLPPEIHQKMVALGIDEKSEAMLILQKLITKTDVDNHQGRLLIPKRQLLKSENEFLNDQDLLKKLNEGDGKIKVMVIQRSMEVNDREMILALWPTPKRRKEIKEAGGKEPSVRYSLEFQWNQVKNESSINVKDVVQVWAFRYDQGKKLGLALVNLGPMNV